MRGDRAPTVITPSRNCGWHLVFDHTAFYALDYRDVVPALQVHPECRSGSKVAAEAYGSLGRDRPFAPQDGGDSVCRDTDGEREPVCAHTSCFQFRPQYLTGMGSYSRHSLPPDFIQHQGVNVCDAHSPRSARNRDSAPGRRSTGPNVLLGRAERTREPLRSRSFSRSSSVGFRQSLPALSAVPGPGCVFTRVMACRPISSFVTAVPVGLRFADPIYAAVRWLEQITIPCSPSTSGALRLTLRTNGFPFVLSGAERSRSTEAGSRPA